MNFILGSGIIGLIARHLLGADWHIIPYYKSRFFTSNPPLDDNFIIKHERLDEIIKKLFPSKIISNTFYKRSWSINGELITNGDMTIVEGWLEKVFGDNSPNHASAYYHKKDVFQIYDHIRITELYKSLLDSYMSEIKNNINLGQPTKISNGYIYFGENRKPYNKIISTIPAFVLNDLFFKNIQLKTKDIHYLHLYSEEIDLEGANQVLVCDKHIDFYKVVNIAPSRYLFYFLNDVKHPGIYMQSFIRNFEIIDGTMVKQALMLGNMVNNKKLNDENVYPIGGYAEWDHCLDVGSCILRLLSVLDNGK